jgi:hypothetical protein
MKEKGYYKLKKNMFQYNFKVKFKNHFKNKLNSIIDMYVILSILWQFIIAKIDIYKQFIFRTVIIFNK